MFFPVSRSLLMLSTLLLSVFALNGWALDKPLLMEGKKTLYQRVLSVPEASLYQQPDETSDTSAVLPFSVLYVYQRQDGWLKVGHDSFGQIADWILEVRPLRD